jgi:hypothetical protein
MIPFRLSRCGSIETSRTRPHYRSLLSRLKDGSITSSSSSRAGAPKSNQPRQTRVSSLPTMMRFYTAMPSGLAISTITRVISMWVATAAGSPPDDCGPGWMAPPASRGRTVGSTAEEASAHVEVYGFHLTPVISSGRPNLRGQAFRDRLARRRPTTVLPPTKRDPVG